MVQHKLVAALGVATLLLGAATACSPVPIASIHSVSQGSAELALKIGIPGVPDGVDPQEGELLAHVYAAALNAAGVRASVVVSPVDPENIVPSIEAGRIDLIPVYSRLALSGVDSTAGSSNDTIESLRAALPSGVSLLDAARAEDRDAVVVTAVTAEKYKLKSLSDVSKVCEQLLMAGSAEFLTKASGVPGMGSDYNCVPQEYLPLKPTADFGSDSTLWALLRDDVQMAVIHAAAPSIADHSLVVLEDPKGLFASQTVVPLVAKTKVPADVQGTLNRVSAALDTTELGNLNRLAMDGHYDLMGEAATAWLVQKGLIKTKSESEG